MIPRSQHVDDPPPGARSALGAWCVLPILLALVGLLGVPGTAVRPQDVGSTGAPSDEVPGDAWAFLELHADTEDCVVGQVVDLRLRIGLDTAFFATQALPLFRRTMDYPVQVEAPWWDELPGTGMLDAGSAATQAAADASGGGSRTLALGDAVVEARLVEERVVDGRRFTVLELRRRVLPRLAGPLTVPAATLHFAYATGFRDDLVQGQVPLDRNAARVTAQPLQLAVEPLPEAGRPAAFTGAVGRFTLQVEARPRELAVGDLLVLTLHIDGEGELASFDAPPLPPVAGFTSVGRLFDEPGPPRRIGYGLVAADASIDALEPPPFAYYDPQAAGYRTLESAPIPVRVRAATGRESTDVDPAPPDPADPADPAQVPRAKATTEQAVDPAVAPDDAPGDGTGDGTRAWLLAAGVAVLGALAWFTARAWRAARAPAGPAAGVPPLATLREATSAAEADPSHAFLAYLAARLGCSQTDVAGAVLAERLAAAGTPAALSQRIVSCVADLLAARYGGRAPGPTGADVRALAEELERSLGR